MKFLNVFALFILFGLVARADDELFYIGSVTDLPGGPGKGIYVGWLDLKTGKLGPLTLAAQAKNAGFMALSPNQKFLYSTSVGAVAAYAVAKPGGMLKPLNEQPDGSEVPAHVSVDGAGKHVFIANYGSATVACYEVKADGSLGAETALEQLIGSGPNPERQTKSYAHSIYADPTDQFVYVCDLGSDHVWIFQFDEKKGTLTPTDSLAGKVPPGGGPRHLVFSPKGDLVYVANEMGDSVSVFARDAKSGALTLVQTIPTLATGKAQDGVKSAEIVLHPSGRWLYVSNRDQTGPNNSITVFSVGADGKLTFVECAPSVAQFPRSFDVDPSGRWLLAAGQNDNRIVLLKIDPETGKLTATDQSITLGGPYCVLFVPKK